MAKLNNPSFNSFSIDSEQIDEDCKKLSKIWSEYKKVETINFNSRLKSFQF